MSFALTSATSASELDLCDRHSISIPSSLFSPHALLLPLPLSENPSASRWISGLSATREVHWRASCKRSILNLAEPCSSEPCALNRFTTVDTGGNALFFLRALSSVIPLPIYLDLWNKCAHSMPMLWDLLAAQPAVSLLYKLLSQLSSRRHPFFPSKPILIKLCI